MRPFHLVYRDLLRDLLSHGLVETNQRTGARIKVLRGGRSITLDLSDDILPTVGCRKTFPKSAAAEVAWFLQGTKDVEFIRGYAPLWDKFTEADGRTVEAAYGYRWQSHFGRNQLLDAVQALVEDPSNRRVFVSAWDPSSDGLLSKGQKNVPCPTNFTLSILNGELHSSLFLRSSDVFVGLPYDVMGHALLLSLVAEELNVGLGVLHVTLAHAHLYEHHWDLAEQAMSQTSIVPPLLMPTWTLSEVGEDPHGYVACLVEASKVYAWPSFNPRPHVVE